MVTELAQATALRTQLLEKIKAHTARICVIGLGYVGLPLATEFARIGFPVVGLDLDTDKVASINRGESYIPDVAPAVVEVLVEGGKLRASTDYEVLDTADVIFICVPTPFTPTKAPDISYITGAARGIADHIHLGMLVILQSTTHPGTTEEDVLPVLESSGLRAGEDFWLAFVPERINPGDKQFTVANTPKVVGGLTPQCSELAASLMAQMTPQVTIVSSPRAAEMSKLLENIFRSVNISLVNELALLAERMQINIWEVIDAAATKPFGFMPFYPGPGVGGHCIPVDPYYLSWKAREYDFTTNFIELAAEVNQRMPYHVLARISEALNRQGKPLRGSRVLVLGVAFKRDIDDARNSPAERIIELLLREGAQVSYNDPYVPVFDVGSNVFRRAQEQLESQELSDELLRNTDCVVIITDHSDYDFAQIVKMAPVVVDTRNATRNLCIEGANILRIGVGTGEQ